MRSHIRVEIASPPAWGYELFKQLFYNVQKSDALPYTHGTRLPRLLGLRDYINNYFAMYKRLTRSRICVEIASQPASG